MFDFILILWYYLLHMTHREPTPKIDTSPSLEDNLGLGAGEHYRALTATPNNIPPATLRELADQMSPDEATEQLTGVVDRLLEDGEDEIQGILRSKTFAADPENNFPQIIIRRDSSEADILQGTVYTVIIDDLSEQLGTDYEWSGGRFIGDVKRFGRSGAPSPNTDPSGNIYIGATDPTHKGSNFFDGMEVRRIMAQRVDKPYQILKLAEDLRRRAEGREPTKSEREVQREAIRAELLANRDKALANSQSVKSERVLGRRAIDALTRLFKRH